MSFEEREKASHNESHTALLPATENYAQNLEPFYMKNMKQQISPWAWTEERVAAALRTLHLLAPRFSHYLSGIFYLRQA